MNNRTKQLEEETQRELARIKEDARVQVRDIETKYKNECARVTNMSGLAMALVYCMLKTTRLTGSVS